MGKNKEVSKAWYEKNKERIKLQKQYRKQNEEGYTEKLKEYCKRGDEKRKTNEKRIEYNKLYSRTEKMKTWNKEYNKTIKGKFNSYKKNAKTRNLKFELSFEQFSCYWNKKCEYCGADIETIGIDRINNTIGYTINNIKSCCKICNFIKHNYTEDFIFNHIEKILNYVGSSNFIITENFNPNYRIYKYYAKKRNLVFQLSKENFKAITQKSCVYCGSIENVGIDRLNNSEGYTMENSIPCCKICNIMKNNYTKDYFLNHIQKMFNLYSTFDLPTGFVE